jgi:hypothetical protein
LRKQDDRHILITIFAILIDQGPTRSPQLS